MITQIEARLKELRTDIVEYIDAGADRDYSLSVKQGALEGWFDALEAISGLVATELARSSERIADAEKVLTDPAAFHLHALRNNVLSRMNALHIAGATDYDSVKEQLAEVLKAKSDRLETGVFQPEGDWPGIFIRGDNALAYARQLHIAYLFAEERAKSGDMRSDEAIIWVSLKALSDLLESCREGSRAPVSSPVTEKTDG